VRARSSMVDVGSAVAPQVANRGRRRWCAADAENARAGSCGAQPDQRRLDEGAKGAGPMIWGEPPFRGW